MAAESDFPFAELEGMFDPHLEFKIEGDIRAKAPDARTIVPLDTNRMELTDPFYQAQMFQKGLEATVEPSAEGIVLLGDMANQSFRDIVRHEAVVRLNETYSRQIRDKRLAVSTFMLSVFTVSEKSPVLYKQPLIVAGQFNGFDVDEFEGDETLVALFTQPNFIDPDCIDASNMRKLAVPVLGVNEWHFTRN